MIKSVNDIHSSGDALDFVMDNQEYLQRIEELIPQVCIPSPGMNPYKAVVIYLEYDLELFGLDKLDIEHLLQYLVATDESWDDSIDYGSDYPVPGTHSS